MTETATPLTTPAAAAESEHPLRADARRNHAAILEAAAEVFAAEGPEAPIDEVARRAGVGVGTLYRHFPTKEALLSALVVARLEPLVAAARAASQASDPGEAFFALVRHLAGEFAGFRALGESIARADVDVHRVKEGASTSLLEAVGAVMARAQQAGSVRPDITVGELAAVMGALCQSSLIADDPSRFGRCVDLVCDGLRLPDQAASSSSRDR